MYIKILSKETWYLRNNTQKNINIKIFTMITSQFVTKLIDYSKRQIKQWSYILEILAFLDTNILSKQLFWMRGISL